MSLTDILFILAAVLAAFKLGQWYVTLQLHQEMTKLLAENNLTIDDVLTQAELETSVEVVTFTEENGQRFAWGQDHRFLAQGQDYDEIFEKIIDRFPGKNFKIAQDNMSNLELEAIKASLIRKTAENPHQ